LSLLSLLGYFNRSWKIFCHIKGVFFFFFFPLVGVLHLASLFVCLLICLCFFCLSLCCLNKMFQKNVKFSFPKTCVNMLVQLVMIVTRCVMPVIDCGFLEGGFDIKFITSSKCCFFLWNCSWWSWWILSNCDRVHG
jgi:hypothetical protein